MEAWLKVYFIIILMIDGFNMRMTREMGDRYRQREEGRKRKGREGGYVCEGKKRGN